MSMIELFKVISVVAIASDAIATYPKIIFFSSFGRQPSCLNAATLCHQEQKRLLLLLSMFLQKSICALLVCCYVQNDLSGEKLPLGANLLACK